MKIKLENKCGAKYEVETNTGVYLKYEEKDSLIKLIDADEIQVLATKNKVGKLEILAAKIDCQRIEFLDLDEKYTILFDEEGLFVQGNPIYQIQYKGNLIGWIPGDFIVTGMDSKGNIISLNEETIANVLKYLNPILTTYV